MHLPDATQPGSKHHQIAGPEPHRLTALGRDADITLQQQAGLLLVVGPGEGADPTAPGGPARHTQALQLGRIRVGRDGDAVGHGGAQKNAALEVVAPNPSQWPESELSLAGGAEL